MFNDEVGVVCCFGVILLLLGCIGLVPARDPSSKFCNGTSSVSQMFPGSDSPRATSLEFVGSHLQHVNASLKGDAHKVINKGICGYTYMWYHW